MSRIGHAGLLALTVICVLAGCAGTKKVADDSPPDAWIDAKTHRRVVRLSAPEESSQTFYFHQNCFTESGDQMVYISFTPEGRSAFAVTLNDPTIRRIAANVNFEVVAPKRRALFYLDGDSVFSTHLDTLETRKIASVPQKYISGRGFSVNADETLLLGCYAEGESEIWNDASLGSRHKKMEKIFEAGLRNALYTIAIETGECTEILSEQVWYGHPQFSPTDPEQIAFCHEGPERRLDRMWQIRADGSNHGKIYSPPVKGTFVTHEFWDPDGRHIWFDLQIPRLRGYLGFVTYLLRPRVYLAKVNISSGESQPYRLAWHERSWHYNISRDGSRFCGDGEGRYFDIGPSGKWIYGYTIQENRIVSERLCDMSRHSYTIAPNAHISPDNQWVVYTSDMHGLPQVYAVKI